LCLVFTLANQKGTKKRIKKGRKRKMSEGHKETCG
jgi:hypothetical protein